MKVVVVEREKVQIQGREELKEQIGCATDKDKVQQAIYTVEKWMNDIFLFIYSVWHAHI